MLDDLIRRIIQAVIESFSIDETKKEDMLRSILEPIKTEEER